MSCKSTIYEEGSKTDSADFTDSAVTTELLWLTATTVGVAETLFRSSPKICSYRRIR